MTPLEINRVIAKMTGIMIHDVTNPPLAARFYSYVCLAGYQVVTDNDARQKKFQTNFNGYPHFKHTTVTGYDYRLSALLAMIETAAKLQPSGALMAAYEQKFLDSCSQIGYSQKMIDSSRKYALEVSKQILKYARDDGYRKISAYKRYIPLKQPGSWYPTPPAYMPPVEPYFYTVRSFTLDSNSQFKAVEPIPFSRLPESAFYKLMLINYKLSASKLSPQQREIAGFWDCNPFAVQDNGHMLIGLKKISPGAHWMGITANACQQAHTDFSRTMAIHTAVAVGLMDSFIGCWGEKYRTNRIRPETAIRELIDPEWMPLLQTPPFPEYLSGHSCISATSAVILTHYFGNHFSYTDSVENKYGLKPRHFESFQQAADEAAISRLYGGIHFSDAITTGVKQGRDIGNWVVGKIKAAH
ncbi:vanadium-dependent haloperoxidase [Mucilaginibacter agri]|nr:vanadium-dependent haloperoxidase [Mucilaginibacter agri]